MTAQPTRPRHAAAAIAKNHRQFNAHRAGNLATAALRLALSLPGERFYRWSSRAIDRALWHDPNLPTPKISIVDLGGVTARFFSPTRLAQKRTTTILNKEPATIAWLDQIGENDVLWDIGANVGVYTIYAAMKRGCRVIAFEPGAANYFVLNRNLELNKLDGGVTAYGIAVAGKSGFDRLFMPDTGAGQALSNYGAPIDFQGKPFIPTFCQGAAAYCIDDLATHLPFPTHVKIDVDGIEADIISGGSKTLTNERLRSILVELDLARPQLIASVAEVMAEHGFCFVNQTEPTHKLVKNCIFHRQAGYPEGQTYSRVVKD
jgi:FkbM family methyltransferase